MRLSSGSDKSRLVNFRYSSALLTLFPALLHVTIGIETSGSERLVFKFCHFFNLTACNTPYSSSLRAAPVLQDIHTRSFALF